MPGQTARWSISELVKSGVWIPASGLAGVMCLWSGTLQRDARLQWSPFWVASEVLPVPSQCQNAHLHLATMIHSIQHLFMQSPTVQGASAWPWGHGWGGGQYTGVEPCSQGTIPRGAARE